MSKRKKRPMSDISEHEVRAMYALFLRGLTDYQIAQHYNCSTQVVAALLDRVAPDGSISSPARPTIRQQEREAAEYLKELLGYKPAQRHIAECIGHSRAWMRGFAWRIKNEAWMGDHPDAISPTQSYR